MKREELDLAIRVATLDLMENLADAAPFGTYVMAETHSFYVIELCKRFIWDQANGKKLKIDRTITEANKVTRRHFRDKDAGELAKMLGYTEETWEPPLKTMWKEKEGKKVPQWAGENPYPGKKEEKSPSATVVDATSTETSPSTTTDTPSDSGKGSEPTAPSAKQKNHGKENKGLGG